MSLTNFHPVKKAIYASIPATIVIANPIGLNIGEKFGFLYVKIQV